MKALNEHSWLARQLGRLAVGVCRHPRWFFWPQIALFIACVIYTLAFLKTDMNRDNLVGPNQQYHQNYLALQKEFPQPDDLVVVVESDSPEKNRQFVERIAAKMQAETNLFRDVFFQQNLAMMGTKALQFAEVTNLVEMRTCCRRRGHSSSNSRRRQIWFRCLSRSIRPFARPSRRKTRQNKSLVKSLPALDRIVSQANDALMRPGTPPSPNVATLLDTSEEALEASYLTFAHGRIFLVTCHAPQDESADTTPVLWVSLKNAILESVFHQHTVTGDLTSDAVDRLRELVQQTRDEVPGVNVGITGEPVLDYDEMTQSQKDTALASVVSLVLCAFIFIYGYNETGRPVKATFCLVIGLGYTMALTTLTGRASEHSDDHVRADAHRAGD